MSSLTESAAAARGSTTSNRGRLLAACLVVLSGLGQLRSAPSLAAEETLTNESVLQMVEAGFSEGIIIEKIRTSKCRFDTSVAALADLKEKGVGDQVLRLMINPDAEVAAPAAILAVGSSQGITGPFSATPVGCEMPAGANLAPWLAGTSPAMWHSEGEDGKRVEMLYERGTIQRMRIVFVSVTMLEIKPMRAPLRLGSNPVFWSCINPNDMPLVKFSVDDDDNERNTTLGRGGPYHEEVNISEDDLVPMTFEKTPQGYFRIRASQPLEPGEYGFVPQATGAMWKPGERVYGFGVD